VERITSRPDTNFEANSRQEPLSLSGSSFLEVLVDPPGVFQDPHQVVGHPKFSHEEKRIILLSWIRDELIIEQVAKKALPDLQPQSRIDAVIKALSHFDPCAAGEYLSAVASIRARCRRRTEQGIN